MILLQNYFKGPVLWKSGVPSAGYLGVPRRLKAFEPRHLLVRASRIQVRASTTAFLLNPVLPQKLACSLYMTFFHCLPLLTVAFYCSLPFQVTSICAVFSPLDIFPRKALALNPLHCTLTSLPTLAWHQPLCCSKTTVVGGHAAWEGRWGACFDVQGGCSMFYAKRSVDTVENFGDCFLHLSLCDACIVDDAHSFFFFFCFCFFPFFSPPLSPSFFFLILKVLVTCGVFFSIFL